MANNKSFINSYIRSMRIWSNGGVSSEHTSATPQVLLQNRCMDNTYIHLCITGHMKNEWTRRSIKSRTELSFTQINSGHCAIETKEDKEQEISRGHNTYTLVTVLLHGYRVPKWNSLNCDVGNPDNKFSYKLLGFRTGLTALGLLCVPCQFHLRSTSQRLCQGYIS